MQLISLQWFHGRTSQDNSGSRRMAVRHDSVLEDQSCARRRDDRRDRDGPGSVRSPADAFPGRGGLHAGVGPRGSGRPEPKCHHSPCRQARAGASRHKGRLRHRQTWNVRRPHPRRRGRVQACRPRPLEGHRRARRFAPDDRRDGPALQSARQASGRRKRRGR